MMTKKKFKKILNIILIILLCEVCATLAFEFKKSNETVLSSFSLKDYKNTDEASVLFWNWLLKQTKLTPQTAALHNIYQTGSVAKFVDLNKDNSREIIGTHYSSAITGGGDCHLYILRYEKSNPKKYKKISNDIHFDTQSPINILQEETNGYHKITVYSKKENKTKIYSYNKRKDLYE